MRAATLEELSPLQTLCQCGRLFEVQDWVRQGKPIALPEGVAGRYWNRNPLRIAMSAGFHSLVQVLLEAGAPLRDGGYHALRHAVELKRPDLAALLLEHGAKVQDVRMRDVLDTWEPGIVNLFLSKGADLNEGYPVAWALIHKIRPALGLLKREDQTPDVRRQGDIALRFHAYEGNVKWVSLMLWAGADPLARGPYRPEELDRVASAPSEDDEDELPSSAVELAALYERIEVLKLKKFAAALDPQHHGGKLLTEAGNAEVLTLLLDHGHRPDALADHGTDRINSLLRFMTYDHGYSDRKTGIDSSRSREHMRMVHLFIAGGARWLPSSSEINDARRSLLKMTAAYTLEFLWFLRQYRAARKRDVQTLLRSPALTRLLGTEYANAMQIMNDIPDQPG